VTSDPSDLPTILALGVELATRAAEVHAAGRRRPLRVDEKGSPFDLVTEVDRQAERVIVDGIVAARPDDEILGEEGAARHGSTGIRWIVDPLDGTANYVYGYPAHAVSIGVEVEGEPVIGVVFDTGRDVLYAAARGGPATANGEPIHANAKEDVETAMVATGFSFVPALRVAQAEVLARMLGGIRDVRRSGAASIDLCALAAGTVDAYFEGGLAPWDVAGGSVVAEAAGATVVRGVVEGYPGVSVMGANPGLLDRLAPVLRDAGFDLIAP
jgi:myo-inositol-1(or 4)-monophosphatase